MKGDVQKMVLAEDVEVFGLHEPLRWPAGTLVTKALRSKTPDAEPDVCDVVGPDGRGVRLPARLFKPVG